MTTDNSDHLKKILEERGKLYGDAVQTHADIAQAWSALWRNKLKIDLSAEDVALGMTLLKLIREQRSSEAGLTHVDNFDDAHNYLTIAQNCSTARPQPSEFVTTAHAEVRTLIDNVDATLPPLVCDCFHNQSLHVNGRGACTAVQPTGRCGCIRFDKL